MLLVGLSSVLNLTIGIDIALAQEVREDTALNTQVNPTSNAPYEITGGTTPGGIDGNLLFHSFESFSLDRGQVALFNHGTNIETILSFVTGNTASIINGIITAGINGEPGTGNADIFIVNPEGITFGPDATLNIGGSFMASTAEQIIFDDGIEFSARNPQPASLLTVSQSIGLSLGEFSGSIENSSRAFSNTLGFSVGLEVLPGESIMLIGNGISLSGGGMTSPSGRIELTSLDKESSVNLTSTSDGNRSDWALESRNGDSTLRDIEFSSNAFLVGTDFRSSNSHIRLRGRQISLNDSDIFARNYGAVQGEDVTLSASEQITLNNSNISADNFGTAQGGDVTFFVPGRLILNGSNIFARNVGIAQGGDVTFSAFEQLTLDNQSLVSVSTFSRGNGGNIDINVLDGTVELLDDSRLLAQSEANATGAAGDVTISAESLSIKGGANVSVASLGGGQGGNLVINTLGGSVEVTGISSRDDRDDRGSFLSATTVGSQNAGEIRINTGTLLVQDSGQIRTETRGKGDGGLVLINATESVVVRGQSSNSDNPSRIFSTTAPLINESLGNAGPVKIITDYLEVSEGAAIFTTSNSTGQGGDLTVEADEVVLSGQSSSRSGLYARARSTGPSGIVNLTVNTLRIEDGARLTVSNREPDELLSRDSSAQGSGTVRDANITAQSIRLNDGQITAESLSGNGGNLNFTVQDVIFLRNGSLISATAGTAEAGGDGGNIDINIPNGYIIAVPNENSDIIANAFSGTGGNIDITSQDIIGLATRTDTRTDARDNTTNDIEASSRFGSSGTITLNNLGIDPAQGLVELPTNTAAPNPIAQGCLADSEGRSTFVVTGQGGTPPNPSNVVRNEAVGWVDLGRAGTSISRSERQPTPIASPSSADEPIVEAQGWQRDRNGQVTLIAQAPNQQTIPTQYSSCAHQSRS